MIIIQPSIDPVIFSLGFIDIRWYSLSYIVGLLLGLFIIKKLNLIKGNLIEIKKLDNFFVWAVIGIVIGGRFGYVLFYQTELFLQRPIYVLEIWNGGMSFHGGLLGIIISTYFFTKINNLKFFYLSDLISVVAPIGLFLGRIANFINTELIGRPTDFYFAIIYPDVDNIPRHPSQLYEAFFEGFILFIVLFYYFVRKGSLKNYGYTSGIFLILYSLFRFFIEFLREPDIHLGLLFNIISMGQLLSIPFFIFGLILIKYNGYKTNN